MFNLLHKNVVIPVKSCLFPPQIPLNLNRKILNHKITFRHQYCKRWFFRFFLFQFFWRKFAVFKLACNVNRTYIFYKFCPWREIYYSYFYCSIAYSMYALFLNLICKIIFVKFIIWNGFKIKWKKAIDHFPFQTELIYCRWNSNRFENSKIIFQNIFLRPATEVDKVILYRNLIINRFLSE